jgi:hypothetical protein
MNIRKDKELNILAKAAGKKATEVETIIVNQLIQKEMIQDDPVCGGEMEVTDADYKCCGGDGYLTPYEYEPIFEEKTCKHCGHVE